MESDGIGVCYVIGWVGYDCGVDYVIVYICGICWCCKCFVIGFNIEEDFVFVIVVFYLYRCVYVYYFYFLIVVIGDWVGVIFGEWFDVGFKIGI